MLCPDTPSYAHSRLLDDCSKVLQDKREAPQLPASYSVMALLAMVPIAFFTVMDPRAIKAVQAHNDLEQS